ncbi:alpha/beta hydrolase [Nocardioides hwasunensis]|uniref:Alpha/beta hydrolase fold domain-containing protein n=1 Tax=Nocardioides hwasunensis TaxID=397258 RepID=A0ABR8MNN7_9ACTN|nr:alpha/beta hydrolase fold domain-containing protein [Nocardioides hwasunensis]MBD3915724.1 alpha/beta hydrolase fold domain-containing protein [Nocardioides hwasunensis]
MPSLRHQLLAAVVPRIRGSRDIDDEQAERDRVERWHRTLDRTLPTRATPGFARRWAVTVEDLGFPSYVLEPRHRRARRTLHYVHGGGFMAPIDAFHVRYATRLADRIGARVVLPDYPLAPEHTWADSHDALVEDAARWAARDGGAVLAGDSAGGGLALAMALSVRDRGLTAPTHLVMHAPWVDLTTSTAEETRAADAIDPWLFHGKLLAYAEWWAGSAGDLGRREVSPALADLSGLPRAMVLYGTRDLLHPGCRLLARRAAEAGWDLIAVEEPDLIHVYGLLPLTPEGRRAMRQVVGFVG